MENNYKEYLESFAWKAIKKMKLEEQPECECCSEKATTVHHLSYERRGMERDDDIVSICERCHNECHYVDGYQIKNDEKILRKRFEDVKEIYLGNGYSSDNQSELKSYKVTLRDVFHYDTKIEGADSRTFEIIDNTYTKDKNNAYRNGYKIDGIFINSFEIIDSSYCKDSNYIYYHSKKIFGSDSKSFKLLKNGYSKDINNVYNDGKIVEGFDAKTFKLLDYGYKKDKNFVYNNYNDKISYFDGNENYNLIPNSSFKIINKNFAKDKKNLYFINDNFKNFIKIFIDGIDSYSFEFISSKYWRDINSVFYVDITEFKEILGSNPLTLECVNRNSVSANVVRDTDSNIKQCKFKIFNVITDGNIEYIYYYEKDGSIKKVEGLKNFINSIEKYYKKDNNMAYYNFYLEIKKIPLSDPNTFKIIDKNYNKDIKYVYNHTTIIEGADPNTFEFIDDIYRKDKYNVYYYREKIENSDPKSFKILIDGYSKDKYNVYHNGKILLGSDPKTFTYINRDNVYDKNNTYYLGKIKKKFLGLITYYK
ncbi:MAG: DKNYY domain-containing protein [Candidatus Gracilibacteria bacterium]|nr:DKNYY domain-containing protein [Candidatus Gracilibacteria bacterium]